MRDFSAAEGASVPVHSLLYSARRASDRSMLDEGRSATDPEWQRELHDELIAAARWHRTHVLAAHP